MHTHRQQANEEAKKTRTKRQTTRFICLGILLYFFQFHEGMAILFEYIILG